MLTGAPLPIAILNRSPIITGGENRIESGRVDIARVTFPSTGIAFTAVDAGKFLAIWSTETLRQSLSVAVASPSSAAIARNENEWNIRNFDQLMSVSYAPLVAGVSPFAAGNRWNVSAHTKQTRSFMPFEHVSHSWLCDLDAGETSALTLTIADATELKWMLAVIRIPGPTVEYRNPNIYYQSNGSATPGTGVTTSTITTYEDKPRRVIASTSAGGTLDLEYAPPRASTAYTARVRLLASLPSIAGTVTVSVLKGSTSLGSTTMTIPLDGFQEWELAVASTEFTGTELLTLRFTGIDAGERFEMEFSFNAA